MQKEAPQNEASYFSHGLREAAFLYRAGPFADVRFWHKADITLATRNVRYWG
jgi:hypothetical protein